MFCLAIFWHSFWGWVIFTAFGTLAGFGVVYEVLTMLENIKKPSFKLQTSIAGAITIFLFFMDLPLEFMIIIPTLYVILLWLVLLFSEPEDKELILRKAINSAGVLLMIVIPLSFLALIYMDGEGFTYEGRLALLFLVLVTKSGDTGAYCVGMLTNKLLPGGNHKIVPKISPKKSWEGTMGGMLSSILVSYLMYRFAFNSDAILEPLIPGILLFWGGFFGDLAESSFKRTCKIKDSGSIIPGMGGFFDVLDSLIFNAPLFYFYCLMT
jgi:phosphatidate cytidylyltransferase